SRRRHTRFSRDWSSDVCSSDLERQPIALVEEDRPLNHVAAPYFVEHVRRWAQGRFGHTSVFYGGLRIYTTLDMGMQRSAEAAVQIGRASWREGGEMAGGKCACS